MDLFYGVDYHSHLGTRRGGMATHGADGFCRSIHNIENSPFRTKFERDVEELTGNNGLHMPPKRAGHTGEEGADTEDGDLLNRQVDAQALCCHIIVAHGDQAPAILRTDQAEHDEEREQ